jgi:hypothetical protein
MMKNQQQQLVRSRATVSKARAIKTCSGNDCVLMASGNVLVLARLQVRERDDRSASR